jgi:hypothetical protein
MITKALIAVPTDTPSYEFLQRLADHKGRSIARLVRELIVQEVFELSQKDPVLFDKLNLLDLHPYHMFESRKPGRPKKGAV